MIASLLFRIVRTFHAWLGLALCLFLLLASLTGTLLLWKQEYLWLTLPEARQSFQATPEALASLGEAVDENFGDRDVLAVFFPASGFGLTRVMMDGAHYAYLSPEGQVVAEWHQNERPEEWLYDLHHRLLLGDGGLTLMGLVALAGLLLVVAGLISWWPRRRGWSQGLWPSFPGRAGLLQSHRNLGVVLVLPLTLTLLTALVLAFPRQVDRMLVEPVRRSPGYGEVFADNLDEVNGPGTGDWLPALQRSMESFPGAEVRSATVPGPFSPYRVIGLRRADDWHPEGMNKVYIDAREGYMDIRIDSQDLPWQETVYNLAGPLHTGRTGSLLYKWLLTLAGLGLALLSGLGGLAYCKKMQKI